MTAMRTRWIARRAARRAPPSPAFVSAGGPAARAARPLKNEKTPPAAGNTPRGQLPPRGACAAAYPARARRAARAARRARALPLRHRRPPLKSERAPPALIPEAISEAISQTQSHPIAFCTRARHQAAAPSRMARALRGPRRGGWAARAGARPAGGCGRAVAAAPRPAGRAAPRARARSPGPNLIWSYLERTPAPAAGRRRCCPGRRPHAPAPAGQAPRAAGGGARFDRPRRAARAWNFEGRARVA